MGPACIPTLLWRRLVTTPAWSRSSGHITPIGEHGIPSPQPHLHFIGIGIPISGLLHKAGKDSRQTAASVAHDLRHYVK
jgi:hypothetical protein